MAEAGWIEGHTTPLAELRVDHFELSSRRGPDSPMIRCWLADGLRQTVKVISYLIILVKLRRDRPCGFNSVDFKSPRKIKTISVF